MASHLLLDGIDLSAAPKESFIIEVGSVREPGPPSLSWDLDGEVLAWTKCKTCGSKITVPSSLYFERKARQFGLQFLTVDFSERSWRLAQGYVGNKAILGDGKGFLESFEGRIAVLYLDSFDYPHNEAHAEDLRQRAGDAYAEKGEVITRERSVEVHFEQFIAALPKMTTPCWVIVDNTHRESRLLSRLQRPFWGKGERVVPYAINHGFQLMREGLGGVMLSRSEGAYAKSLKSLHLYCAGGRTSVLYRALGYRPPVSVLPK